MRIRVRDSHVRWSGVVGQQNGGSGLDAGRNESTGLDAVRDVLSEDENCGGGNHDDRSGEHDLLTTAKHVHDKILS